jgi:hypothetical protein
VDVRPYRDCDLLHIGPTHWRNGAADLHGQVSAVPQGQDSVAWTEGKVDGMDSGVRDDVLHCAVKALFAAGAFALMLVAHLLRLPGHHGVHSRAEQAGSST